MYMAESLCCPPKLAQRCKSGILQNKIKTLKKKTLNIKKTKIMVSGPITSCQIDGETVETVIDFILGATKSLQMVAAPMKLKDTCSLEEKL